MKNIDIHGMTNMELIRGGIAEWYWATDYIHGDLYEAEELFRQGHLVRSNRLYLIHYPDGMIYEPVHSADGQYLGTPVYDGSSVVLLVVSFTESVIRIMRFLHQQVEVQEVARLPLSAVKDCYNLMLHTSPLSLTRQPNDGTFEIIWPEHVRFAINDREALNFRDGDKLYFNVWYEDPDYREETVVRSLHDGTILERFPGDIRIMPNGVDELYEEGVRLMTLTWNYENCIGSPNSANRKVMRKGLKPFGIETVRRMNELGMIVDVSHLSDGGFYDCVKYSEFPIVASHSNARSLCLHPRNLTDEMLRLLGNKGGVAGVNFYSAFLRKEGRAEISDIVKHILYMIDKAGEDAVALGTDFDGFSKEALPGEIRDVEDMWKLWERLERAGLTGRQIEKFASGNILRVMNDVLRKK